MSDNPTSNDGSFDAEIIDNTIQRNWDRLVIPDLSVDPGTRRLPLAMTSSSATKATIAIRALDSLQSYDATTTLGDTVAKADSTVFAQDDIDVLSERGAF